MPVSQPLQLSQQSCLPGTPCLCHSHYNRPSNPASQEHLACVTATITVPAILPPRNTLPVSQPLQLSQQSCLPGTPCLWLRHDEASTPRNGERTVYNQCATRCDGNHLITYSRILTTTQAGDSLCFVVPSISGDARCCKEHITSQNDTVV